MDQNQISVTVPAHLYAIENELEIHTLFSNDSEADTYKIELRQKNSEELLCDAIN